MINKRYVILWYSLESQIRPKEPILFGFAGYRHVYLEGLTEASIFVHITINEIFGKVRKSIKL